ncbi:MAG TPA: hypothetical protein PLI86_08245, partial [bacterium]|nr:hypothetical protein [bacterium]
MSFQPALEQARVERRQAGALPGDDAAPERFRRLFVAGGQLLADGPTGLRRHDPARGFELVREASAGLPAPHVNALAADGARLWLGFFDGGL